MLFQTCGQQLKIPDYRVGVAFLDCLKSADNSSSAALASGTPALAASFIWP